MGNEECNCNQLKIRYYSFSFCYIFFIHKRINIDAESFRQGKVGMNKQLLLFIFLSGVIIIKTDSIHAIDNAHFYRATNLFLEPRFERDLLTTFEITFGGGYTKKGRNAHGNTVPLLDTFGLHNMHDLGVNVPGKNTNNQEDIILIQLARTPGRGTQTDCGDCVPKPQFGFFSIGGEFSIFESNLFFIQNIACGFFTQVHLPIRRIKIDHICFKDISPTDMICPNSTTPIWQVFKEQFCEILKRYDLSAGPVHETGIGDLSILAGWTNSHQDTTVLDFIDTTFKFGILAPTGKQRDENQIFSIPLGYNGHFGFPFSATVALGLYEWLTLAAHIDAIVFLSKTKKIRLKTAFDQSGLIKLASGKAIIDRGVVWNAGLFAKADHICRGISFLLGYSFAQQNKDTLTTCNPCFDACIANSDETLQGFNMHTIHLWAEYDFTQSDACGGVRVALFYNNQIGGKRIFKTNVIGGDVGIDFTWGF